MLSRLMSAFRAAEPAPLPEPDADLALGALLVQVAKSDHDYQYEEISRIDRILARMCSIGPIEAAKMRATCEKLLAATADFHVFADLIRNDLDFEARMTALEALWQVVMADGTQQEDELRLIEDLQRELGLTDVDSATARANAMRRIGST